MASTAKFVTNPPRVRAVSANPQPTSTGVWTRLDWDSVDGSDYEKMRQATGLRLPASGRYCVTWSISYAANTTGSRQGMVRRNSAGNVGAGVLGMVDRRWAVGAGSATVGGTCDIPGCTAGDVLELFAHQASGGSLGVLAGIGLTYFSARWVALD